MKDKKIYDKTSEAEENVQPEGVEVDDVNVAEEEMAEESLEATVMRLTSELDEAKSSIEKEKKEYMFLMSEFDNFRKRTEKEKAQMFEIGAKSVIEKILPVVDSLERGLAAVPEDATEDPFVQGMDKIYKQLMAELEGLGVKPIEAVGTEFNPDFHNAVMQVESEELESGMVAQEMQKGYLYRDSVVRHSMVSVVQ